jgi:hypothetical protein
MHEQRVQAAAAANQAAAKDHASGTMQAAKTCPISTAP